MLFKSSLFACAAVTALTCGSAAVAQTSTAQASVSDKPSPSTLTEVVVTAERRTVNLQNTAIAATVLTQHDLTKAGVFTQDQLQFVSPGLTVNNFGSGADIEIRGIGKGEHNVRSTTGVITYRDGVATFPGFFQDEPYYDVADVEVLRGPQGTFSGQNATGGAIIVNSQDPKIGGGYRGYVQGSYGNYNDTTLQGALNIPISDTFAARIAINDEYRSSFYHITGLSHPADLYWSSARLSLLWTPAPAWKISLKVDGDYLNSGGYFGDPIINPATGKVNPTNNLYNLQTNYPHPYATDQFLRAVLKIDYVDPSSGMTFRSISGYQDGRAGYKGDIDGTALPSPNYTITVALDEHIYSQEFNIISPDKGPFSWIVGASYQDNQAYFPPGFDIATPPGALDENSYGSAPTHTWGAFGQVSYKLPAGFELQAGLRYSDWDAGNFQRFYVPELLARGVNYYEDGKASGSNVTGKVNLNLTLDRDNFLYAFVATGAKPGGVNTALYLDGGLVPPPFKQEYVTDYELGWKARLFDSHVRTQLGLYYSHYSDFQVVVPLANNPAQSTEISDPSPSKLYGIEASAQGAFGDLSFNASLAWEHTALGAFHAEDNRVAKAGTCDPATGPTTAACIDLGGHPQTYAPDFTGNFGVYYNLHVDGGDLLTPGVQYSYISGQWGTVFDNRAQGDRLAARRILGATLAWTHGDFVATLYARNLTNDQYVSALYAPIRFAGAPRQFGVSLLKKF